MKKGLSPRQLKFANEYLVDRNATAAYKRAGYKGQGATAGTNAARMLKNARVAAYIRKVEQKDQKRLEITRDRVLQRYARIAFGNIADFAQVKNGGVTFTETDQLPKDQWLAVAELGETTTKEGGSTRLKMLDPIPALNKLGEHLGLFQPETPDPDKKQVVDVRVTVIGAKREYNFGKRTSS
jgi:phage terminase small subunit